MNGKNQTRKSGGRRWRSHLLVSRAWLAAVEVSDASGIESEDVISLALARHRKARGPILEPDERVINAEFKDCPTNKVLKLGPYMETELQDGFFLYLE